MTFVVKKIVAALILPTPIILGLLLFGFYFIAITTKYTRTGLILIFLSLITLLIFSTPFIPHNMISHLEKEYPILTNATADINSIVVLGAGNNGNIGYPSNQTLSSASLSRLVEGIRLYKLNPKSTLILSGGKIFGSPADADTMNNVATMLGVNNEKIKIENGSKDTYQEAKYLKKILKNKPFILVTSGYHMPRAMLIFKSQGMQPIAAPTEIIMDKQKYSIKKFIPNAINLIYSDLAIHEYLGILWFKLKQLTLGAP